MLDKVNREVILSIPTKGDLLHVKGQLSIYGGQQSETSLAYYPPKADDPEMILQVREFWIIGFCVEPSGKELYVATMEKLRNEQNSAYPFSYEIDFNLAKSTYIPLDIRFLTIANSVQSKHDILNRIERCLNTFFRTKTVPDAI